MTGEQAAKAILDAVNIDQALYRLGQNKVVDSASRPLNPLIEQTSKTNYFVAASTLTACHKTLDISLKKRKVL